MAKREIITPKLIEGDLTVGGCSVTSIDDIIGTPEDYCTLHYELPNIEYNYGYDYITATGDRCILGYYIGIDVFVKNGGQWAKEYILKEYAVFEESVAEEVESLLFRHLTTLARARGCSKIVCTKEGANQELVDYFARGGFSDEGELFVLELGGVALGTYDALLVPREGDALDLPDLFFLGEQGFSIEEDSCIFSSEEDEKYIIIDRKSGLCHFSGRIEVYGGEVKIGVHPAMAIVDVLCQLNKMANKEDVKICLQSAKKSNTTPDVLVGDFGIFLPREKMSMKEELELKMALRVEGVLKKYDVYTTRFDFEVGGSGLFLCYKPLP